MFWMPSLRREWFMKVLLFCGAFLTWSCSIPTIGNVVDPQAAPFEIKVRVKRVKSEEPVQGALVQLLYPLHEKNSHQISKYPPRVEYQLWDRKRLRMGTVTDEKGECLLDWDKRYRYGCVSVFTPPYTYTFSQWIFPCSTFTVLLPQTAMAYIIYDGKDLNEEVYLQFEQLWGGHSPGFIPPYHDTVMTISKDSLIPGGAGWVWNIPLMEGRYRFRIRNAEQKILACEYFEITNYEHMDKPSYPVVVNLKEGRIRKFPHKWD